MITSEKEIKFIENLLKEYKNMDKKLGVLDLDMTEVLNCGYSVKSPCINSDIAYYGCDSGSPVEKFVIAKENAIEDIERRKKLIENEKKKVELVYECLNSEEKSVFKYYYCDDLTYKEVCNRMNIDKANFISIKDKILIKAIEVLSTGTLENTINLRKMEKERIDEIIKAENDIIDI